MFLKIFGCLLPYEGFGKIAVFFGHWGCSQFWGDSTVSTKICLGYNCWNRFVGFKTHFFSNGVKSFSRSCYRTCTWWSSGLSTSYWSSHILVFHPSGSCLCSSCFSTVYARSQTGALGCCVAGCLLFEGQSWSRDFTSLRCSFIFTRIVWFWLVELSYHSSFSHWFDCLSWWFSDFLED